MNRTAVWVVHFLFEWRVRCALSSHISIASKWPNIYCRYIWINRNYATCMKTEVWEGSVICHYCSHRSGYRLCLLFSRFSLCFVSWPLSPSRVLAARTTLPFRVFMRLDQNTNVALGMQVLVYCCSFLRYHWRRWTNLEAGCKVRDSFLQRWLALGLGNHFSGL